MVEKGLNLFFRYKTDPQIKAMTDLVDAYQRREVHLAEKILKGLYLTSFSCWITSSPSPKITDPPLWTIASFVCILASYFVVCALNTLSTL